MKKILLLLAFVMPMNASAYDAQIDGIYYNLNSNTNEAGVISGDYEYTGSVSIPETVTYNGVTYSVTSIERRAFRYCSGLTSVIIGNNVTSIANSTFDGCSGLASVTIGNSVTGIGYYAFSGCSSLTSIEIPNSVTCIGEYNQEIKGVTNVEIIPVSV